MQAYSLLAHELRQHLRLIFLVFLLGSLITVLISLLLPPVYRSSTLILLQEQRLPTSYVESPISLDLGKRLHTISAQIMSRARLEQIINKFKLYESAPSMEKKVEIMRRSVEVQVNKEDTFRISFEHRSPEIAQRTTAELARLFMEENLRDRSLQAANTLVFLEGELKALGRTLEVQEGALRVYKERHIGVLPEQQSANLRALDRLQAQYHSNSEALQATRSRKMELEMKNGDVEILSDVPSEPQLEKLKAALADKRAQYTERHPDVRQLARQVAQMEATLHANRKPPRPEALSAQMTPIDREVSTLETEQETLLRDINDYQGRIERLPEVESKLTLLTRDYETTRDNYQALLKKKFEAQLSISSENKQQNSAFKTLDAANLPVAPISPRRDLIMIFGILASLAIGLGVGYFMTLLDTTIRTEADLQTFFKNPVLTVIPELAPQKSQVFRSHSS